MNVSARVDDGELSRKLARASNVLGKGVGELLRFYSAPAVMDLLRTYPPMVTVGGRDSFAKQKQLGKGAIDRDVGKVYVSLGTVVEEVRVATAAESADGAAARGFAKLVRQGRVAEARALLRRVGLADYAALEMGRFDAKYHEKSRNRRGRVSRRRKAQVVVDVASLRRYVRELKGKIGFLKSGWLRGYRGAGGKGAVPRWISAHGGGAGGVVDLTGRQLNPSFTVINAVNYARVQDARGGLAALVIARSRARMVRGLDGAVRRKLRR